MAHYYLDKFSNKVRDVITNTEAVLEQEKEKLRHQATRTIKKAKRTIGDYNESRKGIHLGSLKDEAYNHLVSDDEVTDVGMHAIAGSRDKMLTAKEYTIGNLQRAVHGVDWNKVENLAKNGTAAELLKTGSKGIIVRSGKFSIHTANSKLNATVDGWVNNDLEDVGTAAMAGLKDTERMAVDGAFLAKNTAEGMVKAAKFTVQYGRALKDLDNARTTLANTPKPQRPPDHWTLSTPMSKEEREAQWRKYYKDDKLYKQNHRILRKAEQRVNRIHQDLINAGKNKVLSPYYNAKATSQQIYRIGQISKTLVKRAGVRTYRVSKTDSASFKKLAGRYREGSARLSAKSRVNRREFYWKTRELKRRKRLKTRRRVKFRRYINAGRLRIKASYQRAYGIGQKSYQAVRAGAEHGVRQGVNIGRQGARSISRAGSKAYSAANKGTRWTYRTGRNFLRTATRVTRVGAAKLGLGGVAAKLGLGGAAAGGTVVAGAGVGIAAAVLLIIGLIAILVFSIITYVPLTFTAAVIMTDEDVFLAYRDKVEELDESFTKEVIDTLDELKNAKRYGCGPDCRGGEKEEPYYNGGLDVDGKHQQGITIKMTDLTPTTDKDGNIIIKTDWQGVLALAAVVFEQNLIYDGNIGDEQHKEEELDFIRQVHSELYQLETETYGLSCPANDDCCGCWYWDDCGCTWTDASGNTHCKGCYVYRPCCIGHAGATVTLTIHTLDGIYHPDPYDLTKEERVVDKHLTSDWEWKFEWWKHLATYDIEEQYPGVRTKAGKDTSSPTNLPPGWPVDRWGYPPTWPPPQGWKPENWPMGLPFLWEHWETYL